MCEVARVAIPVNGSRADRLVCLCACNVWFAFVAFVAFCPITGSSREPKKLAAEHLPNLVQVHERVYSGGIPEDERAFRELRALGIRTIISVDGAKPNVSLARQFHMRYVHLPHGYDGIAPERVAELAKGVRELPAPIYIHCHHGRHRSPAAAGAACIGAGLVSLDHGRQLLELAGTSLDYRGLHLAVDRTQPFDNAYLEQLTVEFRESVPLPPLAEAMVKIDEIAHRLQQVADANWQAPRDHPDLNAAHEGLLLREQYTELLRADDISDRSAEFRQLLRDSEQAAIELETALRTAPAERTADHSRDLRRLFQRVNDGCQSCHKQHRDSVDRSRRERGAANQMFHTDRCASERR